MDYGSGTDRRRRHNKLKKCNVNVHVNQQIEIVRNFHRSSSDDDVCDHFIGSDMR